MFLFLFFGRAKHYQLRRMVNRDGWADYKQKLESVGLTPSDDLFMRDDGRRFGDGMSLWQPLAEPGLFCRGGPT